MAAVAFAVLNPIPFGFFVGALIFDAVYARSADVMWVKSAAWLIAIGLLFAVVPRFINLAWVWFPRTRTSASADKVVFFLNLLGIACAIVNAFVHSRDAFGVMPQGMWLSLLTVGLLVVGFVLGALPSGTSDPKVQA